MRYRFACQFEGGTFKVPFEVANIEPYIKGDILWGFDRFPIFIPSELCDDDLGEFLNIHLRRKTATTECSGAIYSEDCCYVIPHMFCTYLHSDRDGVHLEWRFGSIRNLHEEHLAQEEVL